MMGFCFFVFFDACQGLVHLVFFFGACQCLVALISQNTGRHQINQKQQNPIIYSGLWIPIDWKSLFFLFCFLLFFGACQCFVTLCFVFFVPVQAWWACLMLKRKERIHNVLCSFSCKNHAPMVPKGNHRKQSASRALPSGRSNQV